MQKISFGNREYVKASEVAKRFKYTQDYVGQLCRGDKVDARLVGRVWYVNLESVKDYRKTKHSTQKKTTKAATKPQSVRKRSAVNPVVRPKTARKIQEIFPNQAHKAVKQVVAKYSQDAVSVIPVLGSSAQTTKPSSSPVSENKPKIIIKVRPDSKKSTRYHVRKTPEITLKAKLKVSDKIDVVAAEPDSLDAAENINLALNGSKKIRTAPNESEQIVNFHPSSVVSSADATEKNAEVQKNNLRYSRFFPLATVTLSIVLLVLGILSLGLGHYVESGIPDAKNGFLFDYNLIVKKLLEIVR